MNSPPRPSDDAVRHGYAQDSNEGQELTMQREALVGLDVDLKRSCVHRD